MLAEELEEVPEFQFENIFVKFRSGKHSLSAVAGVTGKIPQGSSVGIIGESGSGKSTLARALMGMVTVASGKIWWRGRDVSTLSTKDIRAYRSSVQMVFQDPHSALNPRRRIIDSVIEPLTILGDGTPEEWYEKAYSLMRRVGLREEHGMKYPHQLSGGQKQRICIARALILNPSVLICDEAVAALDVALQAEVLNLLNELKNEFNLTLIFISHDLSVVSYICDVAYVMYLGKFMEQASVEQLNLTPRHPYTAGLLSAQMSVDFSQNLLEDPNIVAGDIPNPMHPPSGCKFNTRCPYSTQECVDVDPELEMTLTGSTVACHHWKALSHKSRRSVST